MYYINIAYLTKHTNMNCEIALGGSLAGAAASKKVSEVNKGPLASALSIACRA